jgi:hypothetical protein
MKDFEPVSRKDLPINTGIPRPNKYRFARPGIDAKDLLRRTGRLDLGAKGALPSGVHRKSSPQPNFLE